MGVSQVCEVRSLLCVCILTTFHCDCWGVFWGLSGKCQFSLSGKVDTVLPHWHMGGPWIWCSIWSHTLCLLLSVGEYSYLMQLLEAWFCLWLPWYVHKISSWRAYRSALCKLLNHFPLLLSHLLHRWCRQSGTGLGVGRFLYFYNCRWLVFCMGFKILRLCATPMNFRFFVVQ